jgi:hypothetical protein
MQQTLLVSAIALSIGGVNSVHAQTITITQMDFGGLYTVSGTLNSSGTGAIQSVDDFFGQSWNATQVSWFDTHTGTLSWSGGYTSGVSTFSYTFQLTGNQVAAGIFFDWNSSTAMPMLTIFDCPVSGGGICTGASLPLATGPFPGQEPGFYGTTADDFPISGVPVPAAAWLFSSGFIGLIGFVMRRRKA